MGCSARVKGPKELLQNPVYRHVKPHRLSHAATFAGHVAPAHHSCHCSLVKPVKAARFRDFNTLRQAIYTNQYAHRCFALLIEAAAECRVRRFWILQVTGIARWQLDCRWRGRCHRRNCNSCNSCNSCNCCNCCSDGGRGGLWCGYARRCIGSIGEGRRVCKAVC